MCIAFGIYYLAYLFLELHSSNSPRESNVIHSFYIGVSSNLDDP